MLTKQAVIDSLSYVLRRKFRVKNGHLPALNHVIASNFIGVNVASNQNPATDAYIINALRELGINEVRLDFTYGDFSSHKARLLNVLLAEKFAVSLHLVQPILAVKNMQDAQEQDKWRSFVQTVVDQFGIPEKNIYKVKQIEIGTTINRKKWGGYNQANFLTAWQIAFQVIKANHITLVGPNIQDFEPVFNIALLKKLKQNNDLPDILSNNLFCERVTEPESYDHRVFKYLWTRTFKFNLIKKARLLEKISSDFGVIRTISPVAFWAIYRLGRRLVTVEEKQADYAARYFLLLAASGALNQANWGALICQREGLIDNGLPDADYPDLERVAHYQAADGELAHYKKRASFEALKTVASIVQGATYVKSIATGKGLEIHHFVKDNQHIHAAWCANGKAFDLNYIDNDALEAAWILGHRGTKISRENLLLTESPIYLHFATAPAVNQLAINSFAKTHFTIDAHIKNQQYFAVNLPGWRGLVLAKNSAEANVLMNALNPNQLKAPEKTGALRHARNAIWATADPRNSTKQLTVKQPIKMYPHKALLDRFKPSKAKRSWNGAMQLMRRGIDTAAPVAYFEKIDDNSCKQNFYVCEFVKSEATIGQIFGAFASGEQSYFGIAKDEIFLQFAGFCQLMHGRLIYFRDFSGGNILLNVLDSKLEFSLIDTARLHHFDFSPFPFRHRLDDLTRVCNKLDWPNRSRFMQIYMGLNGWQFSWQHKLRFYLYDFKVSLKRAIGRKGIKKLIKRLKGET